MTSVMFTTVYSEFNKQCEPWWRNPLGVLWVICWCGTWAPKHPGALQQRRVTVMLRSFTIASASANHVASPLRRLHDQTITEQKIPQLCVLLYLNKYASLLLNSVTFSFFQLWSSKFSPPLPCVLIECEESKGFTWWEKCRMFETSGSCSWNWVRRWMWSETLMFHWFHLLNPLSALRVRRRGRRGGRLKTEF